MVRFQVITPPVYPAVALTDAKDHLRIEQDVQVDNTLVLALIKAATAKVEDYTGRRIIDTVLKGYADTWNDVIRIQTAPINEITSIQYFDVNNDLVTLSDSEYFADLVGVPSRVIVNNPPALYARPNAVIITFKAGYGTDSSATPDALRQAILLLIGHFYENRQEVITGTTATEIPSAAKYLMEPYCISNFWS